MTASGLYAGAVTHRRFAPRPHRLRYAMFQMLLDLDEAPTLDRRLRWFSTNRFNLFSHYDRDHGAGRALGLRAWVDETLRQVGLAIDGGQVLLLCMPRLLGHVFNPISIYYCHAHDGRLRAVIYEVNNTFGERHCYLIEVGAAAGGLIRQTCAKAFHVSPFMDMALTYEFELSAPGDKVRTSVKACDTTGAPVLTAVFAGARREITDRALIRTLIEFPLLTLKVVAAIHIEALKLWSKGLRLRPSPSAPPTLVTVVRAG